MNEKIKDINYYPYLSSSNTTVLSYGPTINSPRLPLSSVGWKVTLYPFTRPGAGSHVTRKLDIVESEVLRFRGGLKGEAARMGKKGLNHVCLQKKKINSMLLCKNPHENPVLMAVLNSLYLSFDVKSSIKR